MDNSNHSDFISEYEIELFSTTNHNQVPYINSTSEYIYNPHDQDYYSDGIDLDHMYVDGSNNSHYRYSQNNHHMYHIEDMGGYNDFTVEKSSSDNVEVKEVKLLTKMHMEKLKLPCTTPDGVDISVLTKDLLPAHLSLEDDEHWDLDTLFQTLNSDYKLTQILLREQDDERKDETRFLEGMEEDIQIMNSKDIRSRKTIKQSHPSISRVKLEMDKEPIKR